MKHQREVGTGYFDHVANAIAGGQASTVALSGSTEEAQFFDKPYTVTAPPDEDEILMVQCFRNYMPPSLFSIKIYVFSQVFKSF